MNTLKILFRELKAAMIFAGVDKTRYVLNGVRFESQANGIPLIVACDGRRLVALQTSIIEGQPKEKFGFHLQASFLKTLTKMPLKPQDEIHISFGEGVSWKAVVSIPRVGISITDPAKESCQGNYPNWRQVLPTNKQALARHISLNTGYLASFAVASKMLNGGCVVILSPDPSFPSEIFLETYPNFYGVLMPSKLANNPTCFISKP